MTEYVVRFLVGGVVVSAFAVLGDILRPKSFAGLFAAAPSVALATLGIALYRHGVEYAALQSRAITAGAIALAVYSVVVCHLLGSGGMNAPSPAPDYPLSAQVRTVAVEPLRDGPPVHAGGPPLSEKSRAEIEVVGYE